MNKENKYTKHIKANQIKPKIFMNSFKAFITGGLIAIFGQLLKDGYQVLFDLDKDNAGALMIVTLILIAALLTGFGIFDKIGQFCGAGTFVPVTGFANSMTSAALEYKSEGITLGIAANMFKLAGSVITLGVVSAYILGALRYLFGWM